MTDEQEHPDEERADLAVSDWLENGESDSTEKVTSSQKRRIGDLLWIQGLLETAFRPQKMHCEAQIQRAMASIRNLDSEDVTQTAPPIEATLRTRSRWRQSVVWVTAAVFVLCLGVWLQSRDPRRQAFAAIERIREVASAPRDREYLVTLSSSDTNEAKSRQVEAQLFVRGGEAFAVRAPAVLRPGDIWFGRDRSGVWFKPAVGPVLSGSGALVMQQRFLHGREQDAPFLQLTTILERLSDAYRVTLLSDETPDRGSLTPVTVCQHLRAVVRPLKGLPGWLPREIEIHAERETGIIVKMVLLCDPVEPNGLERIQFDFISQSQLPDNWYRPEGRQRIVKE